ncbi:hypothetical protein ACFFX1_10185 [Dactylosporangium sucinum]|uniref:Uncharacterized protein n=1 Tax=Dactylosporangium sucinum TaxID=1424081 RepID=A0A917WRU3_9ACTN|nr:hypothetical protein [Dactylosporangium sucinum]GGM24090.1 hypothetical protein GCM10007977_026550 [Dactylosporangium sucinum]
MSLYQLPTESADAQVFIGWSQDRATFFLDVALLRDVGHGPERAWGFRLGEKTVEVTDPRVVLREAQQYALVPAELEDRLEADAGPPESRLPWPRHATGQLYDAGAVIEPVGGIFASWEDDHADRSTTDVSSARLSVLDRAKARAADRANTTAAVHPAAKAEAPAGAARPAWAAGFPGLRTVTAQGGAPPAPGTGPAPAPDPSIGRHR